MRIKPIVLTLAVAALVAGALVAPAGAALYHDASDRGWYLQNGDHGAASMNYCAGPGCSGGQDERAFAVFDLSGLGPSAATQGISYARVQFLNTNGGGAGARSFSVYGVTTPVSELVQSHDPGRAGREIFDDLGSGPKYGTASLASMDVDPVDVALNGEGQLAFTKRMGGQIAVGGALFSLTDGDQLFASSGGFPASAIQFVYQLGPKTTLVLKGPGSVVKGKTASFRGTVSSADPACVAGLNVQITVGKSDSTEVTDSQGTFSFRAKITKRTKVRAFYEGTVVASPPDPCAGSDDRMLVKVR